MRDYIITGVAFDDKYLTKSRYIFGIRSGLLKNLINLERLHCPMRLPLLWQLGKCIALWEV